jgi:heptosyltransferase III
MQKVKEIVKAFLSLRASIKAIFLFSLIIFKIKKYKITIITLTEHIGDIVACEPVARYFKENNPNAFIIWVVNKRYVDIVKYNPNINFMIEINCLSEWIYLKFFLQFLNVKIFDLHIHKRSCSKYGLKLNNPNRHGITLDNYFNYGSILESFSLASGLEKLSNAPQLFLPDNYSLQFELPKKFIAIQVLSNEEEKNWDINKWNKLIKRNSNYIFVELGIEPKISALSNCISLCGKTSLLDVAFIIKKAELFIGIDSSFAHFANALSIPGIILLGHYKFFKCYLPYTGKYKDNSIAEIINFDGFVYDIPLDVVEKKLRKKMIV